MRIAAGTEVLVTTTNGGRAVVTLGEDWATSFSVFVREGRMTHAWVICGSRVESVTPTATLR